MAKSSLCSIPDCGKPTVKREWCNAHYQRWRKYGSPLAGSTPWGAARDWLNAALSFTKDECLAFPYAKDRHGYGHINVQRRYMGAHVYVAEKVLPPRPSALHEVCHKCGNGNKACVAPRHLYWGTRRQNVQDAIAQGTFSQPPIGLRGKGRKKRQ